MRVNNIPLEQLRFTAKIIVVNRKLFAEKYGEGHAMIECSAYVVRKHKVIIHDEEG